MAATKGTQAKGFQRIVWLPLISTATFSADDFLIYDATNKGVTLAAAAGANVAATAADTRIVGKALANSVLDNGSRRQWVPVMIAEPGTQFELPIWGSSAGAAVATAGRLGVAYELRNANAGVTGFAVNVSATTNTKCVIVNYDIDDYPAWAVAPEATYAAVADGTVAYPLCWAEFLGSACALTGGGR